MNNNNSNDNNSTENNNSFPIFSEAGDSLVAPRDTLVAMWAALAEGAEGLALCVQQTKDGAIVCFSRKSLYDCCGMFRRYAHAWPGKRYPYTFGGKRWDKDQNGNTLANQIIFKHFKLYQR